MKSKGVVAQAARDYTERYNPSAQTSSLARKRFTVDAGRLPWAGSKQRVVLVTGYFDLFHAGHVRFLEACAAAEELLVVGVHSDRLTREHKGHGRPRNKLEHRLIVVAALECVHFVFEADCLYDEDSGSVLRHLHPNIIVLSTGKSSSFAKHRLCCYLDNLSQEGTFVLRRIPIEDPVLFADRLVGL